MTKYRSYTYNNPFLIIRFSHRARFRKALDLLAPQPGDVILDFGMGDGLFLKMIAERQRKARLIGFDTSEDMVAMARTTVGSAAKLLQRLDVLGDGEVNKIVCLEVFEHLLEDERRNALATIRRILSRDGMVVLSVPIEIGPASLIKNVARAVLKQPLVGLTFANTFFSLFGAMAYVKAPQRDHVGFDYRILAKLFRDGGWEIVRRDYSPVALLGPVAASQVFFVLRRRA